MVKKAIAMLMSVTVLLVLVVPAATVAADPDPAPAVWDGTVASAFAGGTGTSVDPFLIANGAQLAYLAAQVNGGTTYSGKYFELTADIALNDASALENWAQTPPANLWTPIGTSAKVFSGKFNGGYHYIKGMYVKNTTTHESGLFGCLSGGEIKNVKITDSDVAGHVYAAGANTRLGGIVGYAINNSLVENCYNGATVRAFSEASGMGFSAHAIAGGIAGYIDKSTVRNCVNAGNIISTQKHIGYNTVATGIVGVGTGGSNTISGCYNIGAIETNAGSPTRIAGIIGNDNAAVAISNCYNIGSLTTVNPNANLFKAGIYASGASTYPAPANSYYLETTASALYVKADKSTVTTGTMSAEQMKASEFITSLNSGGGTYAADTKNANGGYPILSWQASDTIYTVTYHANGGSGGSAVGYYKGMSAKLGAIAAPEKSEYTFVGWATTPNASAPDYTATGRFAVTGDMTLYAVWASDIWDGTAAAGFAGGTGTSADPYLIGSGAQLAYLAQQVNAGTPFNAVYFKLTADITLNNLADFKNWASAPPQNTWTPIGTSTDDSKKFFGRFDGAGHIIRGMYVYNTTTQDSGLFGFVSYATIGNLRIENSLVNGYAAATNLSIRAGGLAGNITDSTVENCYNGADVTASDEKGFSAHAEAGGITANATVVTFKNCVNAGKILAKRHNTSGYFTTAAGIVGAIRGGTTIENCYNTAPVDAMAGTITRASGIAGRTAVVAGGANAIRNCYSTGVVSATARGPAYYQNAIIGEVMTSTGDNTVPVNCHYLEFTASYLYGSVTTGATSASGMKAAAFATTLGSGYAASAYGINGGYPILAWQALIPVCVVTYNANGGVGAAVSTAYFKGTNVEVDFISIPTGEYDFLGWAASQSAAVPEYTATGKGRFIVLSDVTLYAVWRTQIYTDNGDGTLTIRVQPSDYPVTQQALCVLVAYYASSGALLSIAVLPVTELAEPSTFVVDQDTTPGSYGRIYIWDGALGDVMPLIPAIEIH